MHYYRTNKKNFIVDIEIEHIDKIIYTNNIIPIYCICLILSMTAEVYFNILVYSFGPKSINQPSDSYKFDEHKHG